MILYSDIYIYIYIYRRRLRLATAAPPLYLGSAPLMAVLCAWGGTLQYFLESLFLVFSSAQRSPGGRSTQQGGNIYGVFFWKCYARAKANKP
jgi:hypothetical protein